MTPLLQEEQYTFLGRRLTIRSDSRVVLDYIRSLYGRFFDGEPQPDAPSRVDHDVAPAVITFEGDPGSARDLRVDDMFGARTLCPEPPGSPNGGEPASEESSIPPLQFVQLPILHNVARLAADHTLSHGASLRWEGGAIAMPAPSGYGKTTLALALLRYGFQLLSDEVVCIHRTQRRVYPFPRTVRFGEDTRRLLALPPNILEEERLPGRRESLWLLEPEAISPAGYGEAAPLRAVLFLRGPGERPRIEPLSPVTALFEFARLSIRPPVDPASALATLAPVLTDIACFGLVAGDPDATARYVRRVVDELPCPEPTPT